MTNIEGAHLDQKRRCVAPGMWIKNSARSEKIGRRALINIWAAGAKICVLLLFAASTPPLSDSKRRKKKLFFFFLKSCVFSAAGETRVALQIKKKWLGQMVFSWLECAYIRRRRGVRAFCVKGLFVCARGLCTKSSAILLHLRCSLEGCLWDKFNECAAAASAGIYQPVLRFIKGPGKRETVFLTTLFFCILCVVSLYNSMQCAALLFKAEYTGTTNNYSWNGVKKFVHKAGRALLCWWKMCAIFVPGLCGFI
jgi:hypothetical protein